MILFLNLKKCLKGKILFKTTLFAWLLSIGLFLPFDSPLNTLFNLSWASEKPLVQVLLSEIKSQKTSTFEALLPSWEKRFGSRALLPLIQIASNPRNRDTHRYIALMSATKMGGSGAIILLKSLLKDGSWMLRSGALRALCVLNDPETANEILPLVHDPALVVRAEAVEAIPVLKPKGASEALLSAIQDQENYHGNKAQWVPQKALQGLVQLHAKEVLPRLEMILKDPTHSQDTEFLLQTKRTIAALR